MAIILVFEFELSFIELATILISITALLWHIVSWLIDRRGLPVIKLECARYPDKFDTLCGIHMTVTNKGKRALKLSKSSFWILIGIEVEDKPKLMFCDPFDITMENADQFIEDRRLVGMEPLSEITWETETFIDPEDSVSVIRAVRLSILDVYKIVFSVTVKRFKFRSLRRKPHTYHTAQLLVLD